MTVRSETWLEESDFWPIIITAWFKVKSREIKHEKREFENKTKKPFIRDEFEERVTSTFNRLMALKENINNIEALSKYPNMNGLDSFLKKNKTQKSEFMKFIYTNHQVSLVTTLDLCAKLGNIVFDCNLNYKRCNTYSFCKHKNTKGTSSAKILDEFTTDIWLDKLERNTIVHHGGYKHYLIANIENTEIAPEDLMGDKVLIDYFSRKMRSETNKLQDKMTSDYLLCIDYSTRFLNSLALPLKEYIISQND